MGWTAERIADFALLARLRDIWLSLIGGLLLLAGAALWRWGAPLDQRLFDAVRLGAGNGLTSVAAALSRIGGLACLGPLALAVFARLVWRWRIREAVWLFLTIAGGRLIVETIKTALERPRPPAPDRLALVTSYSFPSSHSAGSMVTCLAFAMLFSRPGPVLAPAIAIACAIGWSRIALGVHWPSDVIAGLGFGMLWVGFTRRWLNPSRFRAG